MRNNDLEHIRRLYVTLRQELFTYALSITRDRGLAEDAVHSAFASVLNGKMPKQLKPYVFRCVRNASIDLLKKQQRETPSDSLFDEGEQSGIEAALMIESALEQVSGDERETIMLKVYSGFTFREIAQMRNVSVNTASSWYRRGLEKMKTILEEIPHGRP